MTYIRVKVTKKNFKLVFNDPEYVLEYETKIFRSREKFYEFCLSFFSPGKHVSYSVFSYPQRWYQEWRSSAPYPSINEIRQVIILKSDVKLNSYYVDKYDQALQAMIHKTT
jgi:hypothetical protein